MRDVVVRTVLLAVLLAGVIAARAQDSAKSAPPAPAPASTAEGAPAPAVDAGASKAPAATPPGSRPPAPTQQRFTPSEKVRADFPISFPIDI